MAFPVTYQPERRIWCSACGGSERLFDLSRTTVDRLQASHRCGPQWSAWTCPGLPIGADGSILPAGLFGDLMPMNREVDEVSVCWRLAGGVVTVEVLFGDDVGVEVPEVASDLERGLGVHLGHVRRFGQLTAQQEGPPPGTTAAGPGPRS